MSTSLHDESNRNICQASALPRNTFWLSIHNRSYRLLYVGRIGEFPLTLTSPYVYGLIFQWFKNRKYFFLKFLKSLTAEPGWKLIEENLILERFVGGWNIPPCRVIVNNWGIIYTIIDIDRKVFRENLL